MRQLLSLAFVCWMLFGSTTFGSALAVAAESEIDFNRDIRPILVNNCFNCHGADSASREADLRLDIREDAVEYGAIAPGDVEASSLVERILSDDPDMVMPPPALKKVLTPEEKDLLQRWIASGAVYQPHWSFIPPQRPELPEVKNSAWPKNAIDHFILAELEKRELTPAAEADRATLARRLSLDITGLPPKPELVEAFVKDESPDAYEQLVDQLMATPQWGEHRGRYWLDTARYADTHGIHFDNFREMWTYRDWVIQAFNNNMPFDQFTLEQLGGDLMPDRTLDQQIATGFNRCNISTNEGGIIAEEYLVLYTRDRTETAATTWLALTAGCAACHDHKYDPISQKEFYEMTAFFNNTTQGAFDGNIARTPPVVVVPLPEDRERWFAIDAVIAEAEQQVLDRKNGALTDFATWAESATADSILALQAPDQVQLKLSSVQAEPAVAQVVVSGQQREIPLLEGATVVPGKFPDTLAIHSDSAAVEIADVGDFERDQPFSVSAWVMLPAGDRQGAIISKMDSKQNYRGWDLWNQNHRIGMHIIHSWREDSLKVMATDPIPADTWTHVAITYDGSSKAAGLKIYYNGQLQKTKTDSDQLKSSIRNEVPFKIGQRSHDSKLANLNVQEVQIHQKHLSDTEVSNLATSTQLIAILGDPEGRSIADEDQLFQWWLNQIDTSYRERTAHVATLQQEKAGIQTRGSVAHVSEEKPEPASAYILSRGEYDRRLDQVFPSTPAILPAMTDDMPKNRLGFAQWLLLPEHPLTARVTVNRYWSELFGSGLVSTAGDFGITGDLPINQPLLDWLAIEFRDSGWDTKHIFRLMFLSAAYRQAAVLTPEKLVKDEKNRFLSRGPRFRMDAEMIRDYALSASGILAPKIGGPSVRTYQPDGVWEAVAMRESNTRNYKQDSGESLYRRSMYTFWKRAAPPASMEIFNAPNREVCTVRRERTNTPLQALVTLNDPQLIEAARFMAQRVLETDCECDQERIDYLAKHLVAREFSAEERTILDQALASLREHYTQHPEDAGKLLAVGESKPAETMNPVDLATWTMMVNQLLNLDEVLNK